MSDETEDRPAQASDRGGHRGSSGEGCSPLQARAPFLENWDWHSVVSINQRACARGGAQHGINSEAGAAGAAKWEQTHGQALTLDETIEFLRGCHRSAPFLFFNGNTFATIGRELALALFADLPPVRKRQVSSAIAHYIAGVLDRESMIQIVDSLSASADLKQGDRVKSLKGTLRGTIVRLLDDGRVVWRPDGSESELVALPESLALELPR